LDRSPLKAAKLTITIDSRVLLLGGDSAFPAGPSDLATIRVRPAPANHEPILNLVCSI